VQTEHFGKDGWPFPNMAFSTPKVWTIVLVSLCIFGVDAGYQKSYGRRCYDCIYDPAAGQWDQCGKEIQHHTAREIGMDAPLCYSNCFVKQSHAGVIRRGCYDETENVNPELTGCHFQNGETYCFCNWDSCNTMVPPVLHGSELGQEVRAEPAHSYPEPAHSYQTLAPEPSKVNYVVDHISSPEGSKVHVSRHNVDGRSYVPGEPDSSSQSFPQGRNSQRYSNYDSYNTKRDKYKNNFDFDQSQGRDSVNSHNEEVHGIRNLPKVYLVKNGRILTLAQKRKNYHDFDGNRHEIDVHVQTDKEHADKGRSHYEHGGNGDNTLHHRGDDTITREFVDHTQRQRHIESKERDGTSEHNLGKVQLDPEPTVKNRQLQHYATFDVGDRTIEHHIVEHYVLHHRIKEKLKNSRGVDIKNIDPRTLSLIYRLLHPHKTPQLDKQLEEYNRNFAKKE
jgi:hypothetical protein